MNNKFFSAALGIGLAITAAHAAQAMESRESTEIITRSQPTLSTKLFGSLAGGYTSVRGSEFSSNPDGAQLAAGGLLSFYLKRFVIDGGGGWIMNSINGNLSTGQNLSVRTRAAYAEISPRYRLGERWQLGLVGNLLFGTDVKFGPASESNSFALLTGLKAAYELPLKNWDLRLVAQGTTDIGIAGREVYMGMAGIQFGIPVDDNSREIRTALKSDALPIAQAAPVPPAKVSFEAHQFQFATASDELRPDAKKFIRQVAALLKSNSNWESLEILGHTDQRGNEERNLALSNRRAEAVRKALIQAGIPAERLSLQSFGESRPFIDATSPQAHAKNRRVELIVRNATEIEKLQTELDRLGSRR